MDSGAAKKFSVLLHLDKCTYRAYGFNDSLSMRKCRYADLKGTIQKPLVKFKSNRPTYYAEPESAKTMYGIGLAEYVDPAHTVVYTRFVKMPCTPIINGLVMWFPQTNYPHTIPLQLSEWHLEVHYNLETWDQRARRTWA